MRNLLRSLAWKLRSKRRVRLHFLDAAQSLEGILAGVWAGHYVLELAAIVHDEENTESLGGRIDVQMSRVFFMQEIQ